MQKAVSCLVLSLAVVSLGLAQDAKKEMKPSMHGYIVDAMCAKGMAKKDAPMEAAAKHSKECALEEGCASSGYGLFSEGKWYKFDEAGDKMTKELIESSKTEKGIMADVTGEMKGDKLAVTSIKEAKMEDEKMEKDDDEKEEMEGHHHDDHH
jgi:hypothetical protein